MGPTQRVCELMRSLMMAASGEQRKARTRSTNHTSCSLSARSMVIAMVSRLIILFTCLLMNKGFHSFDAEGRKDPFRMMYEYLPEAPDICFYDFACSLSVLTLVLANLLHYQEYCKNRQGDFFKDTKFLHDILHRQDLIYKSVNFHSYNHVCGPTLKTTLGNRKNPQSEQLWNTVSEVGVDSHA